MPSKPAVKLPPDTRSKMEHVIADLTVVRKADVVAIVESCLNMWTSTLQSHVVKAVQSTSEDTSPLNYINLNKGLKFAILNVVDQALGETVWYFHVATVSKAWTQWLVQTIFVADSIVQSVLSRTESIVPIADTVGKLMDNVVDLHCSRDTKRSINNSWQH